MTMINPTRTPRLLYTSTFADGWTARRLTSEVLRYACVVRNLRDGVCEFRRAFFSDIYDGAQHAARDNVRAYEATGATAVIKAAGEVVMLDAR